MQLIELEKQEYILFSKSHPQALFFQSPAWIEIKQTNGWSGKLLGVKEEGQIKAATVMLFKRIGGLGITFAYAPRGFLLDYNDHALLEGFTEAVKAYLKKKGVAFLKINPYVDYQLRDGDGTIFRDTANNALMDTFKRLGYRHNGFYEGMEDKKDLEPRWLSVLDLEGKTIDEIYKGMLSGTKWGVNNSRKNFLTLIEADAENIALFKDLMQHTADRRGFIDRPLSYYQDMFSILDREKAVKVLYAQIDFRGLWEHTKERFGKNEARLAKIGENPKKAAEAAELRSEQASLEKRIASLEEDMRTEGEKKIIAGGWYMLYGREVVYLFGASYKPFMKYNAQYLLQYEMIDYAINNGYDRFNFYGIDGRFDPQSPNFGLFDFKRGFGATVHELVGEFDLVISRPKFWLYRFAFRCFNMLRGLGK